MHDHRRILLGTFLTSALVFSTAMMPITPAYAQDATSAATDAINQTLPAIGTLVGAQGPVKIMHGGVITQTPTLAKRAAKATTEKSAAQKSPMPLNVGDAVSIHDIIVTGDNAHAVIALIDGTRIALGSNAEMGINNFFYNDLDSKQNFARFRVPVGAFHMITGKISDPERPDVTVLTGYGKIDVRGAEVWGGVVDDLYGVYVPKGQLTIETKRGRIILRENQGTFIRSENAIPERGQVWTDDVLALAQSHTAFPGAMKVENMITTFRPRIETQREEYRDFVRTNADALISLEQFGAAGKRNAMKRIQANRETQITDQRKIQQTRRDNAAAKTAAKTTPEETIDTTSETQTAVDTAPTTPADAKEETKVTTRPVSETTTDTAPEPDANETAADETPADETVADMPADVSADMPTPTPDNADTAIVGPAPDTTTTPAPATGTDPHNPPPIILKPNEKSAEKIQQNAMPAPAPLNRAMPQPAPLPTPPAALPDDLPSDPAPRQEAIEQFHLQSETHNPL